ncbi:MAG: AAA family ATPase [Chloroflexota bacterium]|nr:AAA family ATPase [Chloroflexota bacterium]
MSDWLPHCPQPPDWRIDWPAIEATFPSVRALAGWVQDAVHHAEGDVLTHTRLVGEAMATLPDFRTLPQGERAILFAAALLHDVAKPACTRYEPDGRITARGHARRGAIAARAILWRLGVPFAERERVAALVRWHMVPFHLIDRPDSRRLAITVSQTTRCDRLALLARADARGRVAADRDRLLDNVALFAEYCQEQGCLTAPYPFPSDHARFRYFRDPGRDPDYAAHDDTRCEVTLLSGLPGAGKDHWLRAHLPDRPVISLDALRAELGVVPTEPQGSVIARARGLAREHLRAGRDFAWNGTNLSRELRNQSIGLFVSYNARVRIVYLESPAARLWRQNRARSAPVPEAVIERLLSRWEVPDRTEAQRVDWIVQA